MFRILKERSLGSRAYELKEVGLAHPSPLFLSKTIFSPLNSETCSSVNLEHTMTLEHMQLCELAFVLQSFGSWFKPTEAKGCPCAFAESFWVVDGCFNKFQFLQQPTAYFWQECFGCKWVRFLWSFPIWLRAAAILGLLPLIHVFYSTVFLGYSKGSEKGNA